MESKKISVIIPVYNSSEFLNECVNSVLNQTYKNLEILLIDDGSKDDSLNICRQIEIIDSRVKVFNQKNSGPGAARNKGIKEATGDYVAFVDSDDTIQCDMYKTLVEIMEKYEADIVCSSLNNKEEEINVQVFNREEALYNRLKTHIISDSSCDKLYKKELFNKYSYPVDRLLSEDSALIYKLVAESQVVVFTNQAFYNIRERESSLSRRNYSTGFRFTITTYEEMVDFFNNTNEEKFIAIAQSLAAGSVFFNAGEYFKYRCKDKATKVFIIEHAKKQLQNYKYLTKKNKLLLKLIVWQFELFGVLYYLYTNNGGKKNEDINNRR